MPSFRDICLQVRYDCSLPELSDLFFTPLTSISWKNRTLVRSLSRESLLPVSLHFKACRLAGKPLHVLILAQPPNADGGADQDIADRLLEDLKWCTIEEGHGLAAPLEKNDLLSIRIAVLTSSLQASSKTVGQLVDEPGNGVEYVMDGEGSNGGSRQFAASWSWGDPTFRVTKDIAAADLLWEGRQAGAETIPAQEQFILAFQRAMEELIRSPGDRVESKKERALFAHQRDAVEKWLERDCRGIFKMCTGAGKTVAALAGARALGERQKAAGQMRPPVVVTVPTRILADQWVEEVKRFGFPDPVEAYNSFDQWAGFLDPALRVSSDAGPRFVVTTYCSFADPRFTAKLQRAGREGVKAVWIADEMHNLSSTRLRQAMRDVSDLFFYRLGLSATPEIEGDFSATDFLLKYFGDVCKTYELRDGIADRVLCRYKYYPVPAYLSPSLGGQYLSLLAQIHGEGTDPTKLVDLYRRTRNLLRTSGVQLSRFAGLVEQLTAENDEIAHTLVYCPPGYGTYGSDKSDEIDKDEGELRLLEGVVSILRKKGLSTSSILGETPGIQRKEILKRFGAGSLQTLCAIGCLDEGVDVPSIKRALVLYSVDREKQFVQRRGRILRNPARDDKKVAEIYDIVLLPQGSDMESEQAEKLLAKELRRYRTFAELAMNRNEADQALSTSLLKATRLNQQGE